LSAPAYATKNIAFPDPGCNPSIHSRQWNNKKVFDEQKFIWMALKKTSVSAGE